MINTDKKLIYADLTYQLRGAMFAVYNNLGPGHKEDVYQKALAKELEDAGIPYQREQSLLVFYKNTSVGSYRPDFVVDGKVIVELKAVDYMTQPFLTQLLHYLKATSFQLGLLVNFGAPKLQIKRLVWTGGNQ